MGQPFHTLHRIKNNDTELELWSINITDFYEEFWTVVNTGMPFCILGLIGNGILLWLLCCFIKKTRFIIYIANMTAGDFIILLHYFVAYLLVFLPSHSRFYTHHVKVISLLFGYNSNIYFLTAVSAERYLMVISPVWFQLYRPRHLTTIVCVSVWTLSFILTTIEYFLCHPRYFPPHIIGFLYCHTAIVLQYIINYIIFVPVMVFCTLGLLIKMKTTSPQNSLARLDINIVIIVLLHLGLSAGLKVTVFINYLVEFMPSSKYRRASLILDCVDTTVNPVVYLLVGCWKKKSHEPLSVIIERSLKHESNRTQQNQEQA